MCVCARAYLWMNGCVRARGRAHACMCVCVGGDRWVGVGGWVGGWIDGWVRRTGHALLLDLIRLPSRCPPQERAARHRRGEDPVHCPPPHALETTPQQLGRIRPLSILKSTRDEHRVLARRLYSQPRVEFRHLSCPRAARRCETTRRRRLLHGRGVRARGRAHCGCCACVMNAMVSVVCSRFIAPSHSSRGGRNNAAMKATPHIHLHARARAATRPYAPVLVRGHGAGGEGGIAAEARAGGGEGPTSALPLPGRGRGVEAIASGADRPAPSAPKTPRPATPLHPSPNPRVGDRRVGRFAPSLLHGPPLSSTPPPSHPGVSRAHAPLSSQGARAPAPLFIRVGAGASCTPA